MNLLRKITEEMEDAIMEELERDPTLTGRELISFLENRFNVTVSLATIYSHLHSFNFTLKRVYRTSSSADTPENWTRRIEFASWFLTYAHDLGNRLIFIDETGFRLTMRRVRGWSRKGRRAVQSISHTISTENLSICAALSNEGIIQQAQLYGGGNQYTFSGFLFDLMDLMEQRGLQNCVFVMDNASFHHTHLVQETVTKRGHTIHYLPPYTPFFNPIESFFHQWKVYVRSRRCNNEANMRDALEDGVHQATPAICQNYIEHVTENCSNCLLGERNLH
jgi:hypothetical protein